MKLDVSHKIRLATALVAIGTLCPVSMAASTAFATQSCSSTGTASYDGGTSFSSGSMIGAQAWISTANIAFCAPPPPAIVSTHSFTSAWAMLESTNTIGWIQSGYIRDANPKYNVPDSTNKYLFADYYDGSTGEVFKAGNLTSTGENHHYWVVSQQKGPYVGQMLVDSTQLAATPFDPSSKWPQRDAEFQGETHDPQDDMPGTTAAPAQFTGLGHSPSESSTGEFTWNDFVKSDITVNNTDNSTYYKQAYITQSGTAPGFSIWDSRH